MTWRQKLHFMWLVVMNADAMTKNCSGHWHASAMIDRATERRVALRLPTHRVGDGQKRRQLVAALFRNHALPVQQQPTYWPDNEVEEPY